MGLILAAQKHAHLPELAGQFAADRFKCIGPGGRHPGDPADPAPGQNAVVQTEFGPCLVDQPGICGGLFGIDDAGAPLPRQRRQQRLRRDPALRQKDLSQRHVLPLAHDDGLQQVARIDGAIFQQDLAKFSLIMGGKRGCQPEIGGVPVSPGNRLFLQKDRAFGHESIPLRSNRSCTGVLNSRLKVQTGCVQGCSSP